MIIQNIAYYNRVLQTTLNADFFFSDSGNRLIQKKYYAAI